MCRDALDFQQRVATARADMPCCTTRSWMRFYNSGGIRRAVLCTDFAAQLRKGKRVRLPRVPRSSLGKGSCVTERMREPDACPHAEASPVVNEPEGPPPRCLSCNLPIGCWRARCTHAV